MSSTVRSVCPYCGVGCGIILESAFGRVTGLRGDPDNPVNRGALCPKGATAHEFVHHSDRLLAPMVRRDGALVETTWEDAYATVARGLQKALDDHGPTAVGLVSSARATVEENYLAQKFARVVLRTNQLDQCFRVCHSPTVTGLSWSLGSGAMTNSMRELAEASPDVIFAIGTNTVHSHPVFWTLYVKPALERGATLIVVDPRRTESAKVASMHLALRPGTEIELLNAMASHILAEGLHDEAFVRERTEGFEALRDALRSVTPESVAETVGVDADAIRDAAEAYARGDPSTILYGLGVTEHITGTDNVRALANLALLTGNLGKPGAGVNALRGQNDVQGATDVCRPESLPGYQSWWDPEVVAKFERAWAAKLPVPDPGEFIYCSRMWDLARAGELKALYVIGSDPALTEGDRARVLDGLSKLDMLVVQDVFPTETTKLAHVVLPACTYAEKDGTFVNTDRHVQRVRKAIEPVGRSKPDWLILTELADAMGKPLGPRSPEETWEEMRLLVPMYAGITYARIERAPLQWPCPTVDHPGTPTLHVGMFPRGKARLAALTPRPPDEPPDEAYPLLLTTGRTFLQYNCGSNTRRTRMEKGDSECHVEISAADARACGVADRGLARVRTRRGEVVARVRVTDVREGVIWMPFHFAEAAANTLTNHAVDPECGITELKACAARVEAVA